MKTDSYSRSLHERALVLIIKQIVFGKTEMVLTLEHQHTLLSCCMLCVLFIFSIKLKDTHKRTHTHTWCRKRMTIVDRDRLFGVDIPVVSPNSDGTREKERYEAPKLH